MVTTEEILQEIVNLRKDTDNHQTQIYIVAGVLGGVCGVLLLSILIMIIVVIKVHKRITQVEENRRIAEEVNARKFSAYTGEEVHRRLQQTVNPVGNRNSEYAFNNPVPLVEEYKLNNPPTKF